jgi:hypothetical protein
MRATPINMRRLCDQHQEPIAVPGVRAYSFETGESCSASPGDYFMMDQSDCLKDSEGNEMVVVRETHAVAMVEIDA